MLKIDVLNDCFNILFKCLNGKLSPALIDSGIAAAEGSEGAEALEMRLIVWESVVELFMGMVPMGNKKNCF